jgi:hypothetical protein
METLEQEEGRGDPGTIHSGCDQPPVEHPLLTAHAAGRNSI